jgi:hypothetical protein
MKMISNPMGWLRAGALGGALLFGAATIAGPAAADELGTSSACLETASAGLSQVDEQAGFSFTAIDEQVSVGFVAIDEQVSVGFTALDDQTGAGFTAIEEQSITCVS